MNGESVPPDPDLPSVGAAISALGDVLATSEA